MLESIFPSAPSDTADFRSHSSQRPGEILVVEDNPATLANIARMIQNAGNTVACADTAAKALEMAAIFRPEVVLPDMCGREVCR